MSLTFFFDQEHVIDFPSFSETADDLPACASNNGLAGMINKVHVPASAVDNGLVKDMGESANGLVGENAHGKFAQCADNGDKHDNDNSLAKTSDILPAEGAANGDNCLCEMAKNKRASADDSGLAKVAIDDETANNKHASANNNGLAKATVDKDNDLPDGFVDKHTPSVKPDFKSKRANKKIGHYGKRGGDQKISSVPHPVQTHNNLEPYEYQSRCLTSAGRKVTKTQIIHKLSIVTKEYRQSQMEKEVALSENQCLTKKVSKSKEVVELRTCLMDAHQEVCSTKSHIFKAQQENTATKNELLSREKQHNTQIAAMEKDTEDTLERVARRHQILRKILTA